MSQERSLFVFTIGPVQAFIAASRKLEDVWSGSYLLTLLANHAIAEFQRYAGEAQVEMIFPSQSADLAEFVGKYPVASLPNRFLCMVEATPQQVAIWARQTESAVRAKIQEIIEHGMREVFEGDTFAPKRLSEEQFDYMNGLATEQIATQLELFWAVERLADESFEATRGQLEKQLHAMKRHRLLPSMEQKGLVCTVCGQHEALHANSYKEHASMRDLRTELTTTWAQRSGSYKKGDRIQEREYLCGVCLVKRTGRMYVSTAIDKDVPHYRSVDDIGKGDGYYAILLMDGDNMGQWLAGHADLRPATQQTADVTAHLQVISDRLAHYSQRTVPAVIEEYGGTLLYAGGDDVLAMAPVDQVLRIADRLRHAFASEKTGLHRQATLSAGILIADHKAPLQKLMHHVRRLEQRAKGYRNGRKDALAMAVYPRSGDVREFVTPWQFAWEEEPNASVESLALMMELVNRLGTDFSSTFLYAFKEAFLPLFGGRVLLEHQSAPTAPLRREALQLEMNRLLKRAALTEVPTQEVYRLAKQLVGMQLELPVMLEFVHFLESSRFLSQIVKGRKEVKEDRADTTSAHTG